MWVPNHCSWRVHSNCDGRDLWVSAVCIEEAESSLILGPSVHSTSGGGVQSSKLLQSHIVTSPHLLQHFCKTNLLSRMCCCCSCDQPVHGISPAESELGHTCVQRQPDSVQNTCLHRAECYIVGQRLSFLAVDSACCLAEGHCWQHCPVHRRGREHRWQEAMDEVYSHGWVDWQGVRNCKSAVCGSVIRQTCKRCHQAAEGWCLST